MGGPCARSSQGAACTRPGPLLTFPLTGCLLPERGSRAWASQPLPSPITGPVQVSQGQEAEGGESLCFKKIKETTRPKEGKVFPCQNLRLYASSNIYSLHILGGLKGAPTHRLERNWFQSSQTQLPSETHQGALFNHKLLGPQND